MNKEIILKALEIYLELQTAELQIFKRNKWKVDLLQPYEDLIDEIREQIILIKIG